MLLLTGISFTFSYESFHLHILPINFPSLTTCFFFAPFILCTSLILTAIDVPLCRYDIKMSKFNVQFKCNTVQLDCLCCLPFAVCRSPFALALQVYRLRKNANNLYLNALQFAAAVWRESKRHSSIGRYAALAGDDFNWQIKMCSQRNIDAYECQMRAFQIQIYCEKSTQRQKVCYRNANRLQSNTLARTHAHKHIMYAAAYTNTHTHSHSEKTGNIDYSKHPQFQALINNSAI